MEDQQNLVSPISIRCTQDLRDSLEDLAAKDQRSLANYVRKILEEHVREKESGKKSRAA